ncbi:GGDEF domain-containing protein [Thalassomonas haliotis]|uniref:diguanylate cyclase n=1 Tax=Thalassomonas haliotis TaxID=485448 RepID=A0ABY7VJZ8_9GAMM|nr:GGDEF domain-containing protein [Thalassomonas haliotis]WDE13791.1 GGDEF domain-containing protein [Thalassomonas haliotis]
MFNNEHNTLENEALVHFAIKEKLPVSLIEKAEYDPATLQALKNQYHNNAYALLLFSLTHELFSERQSRHYWHAIVQHHRRLTKALSRDPGVIVATLDYMNNISHCMPAAKIISEAKSLLITEAATKDALTTLYMRSVFDIALEKQCQQACKHNAPVALVLIDIDNFKQVNDSYGHISGDKVLAAIGDCITASVRETDIPARYGGEELAVIMPRTRLNTALDIAERLRSKVEATVIDNIRVTASFGVAVTTQDICDAKQLIQSADNALYQAKISGKNTVCY